MGNKIIILIVCVLITHTGYTQIGKTSNHVGVSGLPIFDMFNFYPDNKISGAAIYLDYGTFVTEHLCFGLNLYYAGGSNEYGTEGSGSRPEKQSIGLTGLNSNLKYYHSLGEKILVFGSISFGFGHYEFETTDLSTSSKMNSNNEAAAVIMAGIGIDYFITKNFAIELNLPYVFVNRLSNAPYVEDFHTVLPTIGVQYYWNSRQTKN